MKTRKSKLDAYEEALDALLLPEREGGKNATLAIAQAQLADGQFGSPLKVSLSRLSAWWQARQSAREQQRVLDKITSGRQRCDEIESELQEHPAPELDTLIKLHKVLILHLSSQGVADPALLKLADNMLDRVIGYAKHCESVRMGSLTLQKYQDQVAERKAVMEREIAAARKTGGITTDTIERIERELKLL